MFPGSCRGEVCCRIMPVIAVTWSGFAGMLGAVAVVAAVALAVSGGGGGGLLGGWCSAALGSHARQQLAEELEEQSARHEAVLAQMAAEHAVELSAQQAQ